MAPRTPRNTPCRCGSGRKYKLCCGTTRDRERELRRQREVLDEIASLPLHFPQLRPRGRRVAALLDRAALDGLSVTALADVVAAIDSRERARIQGSQAKEFPGVWKSLCADLGDERLARDAVLVGAVVAALAERVPLDPELLELIEETAKDGDDPIEPLALVLEAGDLWSVHESVQADEALASIPDQLADDEYEVRWEAVLRAELKRLGSRWHAERLRELVARVHAELPLEGFLRASQLLAGACEAFERDRQAPARLAGALLVDSLDRLREFPLAA